MSHISDFTQEQNKIVLDLINHDNGTNLTMGQVEIGRVTGEGAQVTVTVSAIPGSGYSGEVDGLSYSRLDIQAFMDVFYPEGLTVQAGDAETLLGLLPDINAALGTALTQEDTNNLPLEWTGTPNEILNIQLQIANSNKVYFGSGLVKVDGNDIALADVVAIKVLSGLNLPASDNGSGGNVSTSGTVLRFASPLASPLDVDFTIINGFDGSTPPSPIQAGDVTITTSAGVIENFSSTVAIPVGTLEFTVRVKPGITGLVAIHQPGDLNDPPLPIEAIVEWQTDSNQLYFAKSAAFTSVPTSLPASVTDLSGMFLFASNFNQDISGWDVSNVMVLESTFLAATSFNQDLSGWNTASVHNMRRTFQMASAFNQDISGWNVGMVGDYLDFSLASGLTAGQLPSFIGR